MGGAERQNTAAFEILNAGQQAITPPVRDAVVQNLVSLFRGDYLLARLMLEEGRFMVFQAILCLSAAQNPEDRDSWLTLGRLQARLSSSGLTSRNRIEALVAIFERYGFIERRKAEEDLRISILIPTARMWSADALFTEMHLSPLCQRPDLGINRQARASFWRVSAMVARQMAASIRMQTRWHRPGQSAALPRQRQATATGAGALPPAAGLFRHADAASLHFGSGGAGRRLSHIPDAASRGIQDRQQPYPDGL
ncbi:hypothetical protein V6L77_07465 [Pannonibacter sp. Pt2-lr]